MPSTSVHLPAELLRRLDRMAKRRKVSRNRLITDACRSLVTEGSDEWPPEFFADERMSARDRALLQSSLATWLQELRGARSGSRRSPF